MKLHALKNPTQTVMFESLPLSIITHSWLSKQVKFKGLFSIL